MIYIKKSKLNIANMWLIPSIVSQIWTYIQSVITPQLKSLKPTCPCAWLNMLKEIRNVVKWLCYDCCNWALAGNDEYVGIICFLWKPRNLIGGMGSLFDPCVITIGRRPFWLSHVEVSYFTSGFGVIIWHDLQTLSLPRVLLCDNLNACMI